MNERLTTAYVKVRRNFYPLTRLSPEDFKQVADQFRGLCAIPVYYTVVHRVIYATPRMPREFRIVVSN